MGLVAAVGTAVTAVAGSIGVAVTATALTVGFETIAAVGAGLAVVGAVTHDKALSYVGAGLGLVGGIGAFAAGAGVLGADAASGIGGASNPFAATAADAAAGSTSSDVVSSLAGDTAYAGDNVTGLAQGGAAADAGDNVTGLAQGGVAAGDNVANAGAGANLTGLPSNTPGATLNGTGAPLFTEPTGDSTFVGSETTSNGTAGAPVGQGTVAPATPTTAATPESLAQLPPGAIDPAAGGVNTPPPGQSAALTDSLLSPNTTGNGAGGIIGNSSGGLNDVINFVGNHQLLAYGALTAGGQLLQGLTSTLTPAQVTALNAQAANNQAAANLTTQQTANLAQPRSTASLAPVTGTPNSIIAPPTAGILNGAPPVAVTGVPATAA